MTRAVITGGNGFVGKKLTDELLKYGYTVRILSRSEAKNPPDNPAVEIVKVDYDDVADITSALEGATVVFHLAAAIFAFNREQFHQANAALTEKLVLAAAGVPTIEKFVYLSSQAAAGPSTYKNNPVTEDDEPAPVSDYGQTKLEGEKALENLGNIHKVIIRAPVIYGKNDSGVSKIASWVGRGIMVNTSAGDMFFNFVYVDDLVHALYLAAATPQANGQVFFVCEPTAYTWRNFINKMAAAMRKPNPVMFTAPYFVLEVVAFIYEFFAHIFGITPALNYDKIKEANIRGHWVCSPKKWITMTGQSFTPLQDGLRKSFDE